MIMNNLVIIGAGGCGREVLQWANDVNKQQNLWNIKGFINDDLSALDGKTCDYGIISTIDSYTICDNDLFICAIGDSHSRKMISEKMTSRGAKFTSIIHPSAVIADTSRIGTNVIIYPFSVISDNTEISDGCIINMYSSVAHDSVVKEYCTISAHCDITGRCEVGAYTFMGTSSKMIPGTHIGEDVYICAGSTVFSRIRKGKKVIGNPAKITNL